MTNWSWVKESCDRVRLFRSSVVLPFLGFGFGSLLLGTAAAAMAEPNPASLSPVTPSREAVQNLSQMFSPEIRATLGACQTQGGVDLSLGASPTGTVTCGDGSADSAIPYTAYLGTVTDVLTAGGLLGMRSVIASNPRITPEMISAFLSQSQGSTLLRGALQSAILQSSLFHLSTPDSADLLVDEVLKRLPPTLQSTENLSTLLGTKEQYQQVVSGFCKAPGMSIEQAQQTVPGLNSVQLYAICLQESGLINSIAPSQTAPSQTVPFQSVPSQTAPSQPPSTQSPSPSPTQSLVPGARTE